MTETEKVQLAFCTGYHHGMNRYGNGRLPASPREVHERFPAWTREQVDAYLNGEDDARAADHFRFGRISAAVRNAATSL